MDYLEKVKHFFSFQSEEWGVELYYMVLSDFVVIARRAKPDVAIRFPFAEGERIATVAALPRNDIRGALPSRPNGVTITTSVRNALSAATGRKC